ncbi:hypothetical protein D0N36_14415 [Hymenobacter lapidiphilus]|nr:hypothetical protein D0N36_14415 [Hymenobacter sp. CCM 8763]
MALSSKVWVGLGSSLIGVVLGMTLSKAMTKVQTSSERNGSHLVEYEDAFVNAIVFRRELRQVANVDSLFAQDPYFNRYIRIIHHDSVSMEALSVPRAGERGNYY